jgi:hypothetical protein
MLNDLIKSLSLTLLSSALVSCGGGGNSRSSSNTPQPATVKSIAPYGVEISGNQQTLSIAGTNFVNGMTVSVTNKNGNNYTVSPAVVTSSTFIVADVTVPTVPTDNYVNVNVKSSTGATLGTIILGVYSSSKTLLADVQPIFDAKCRACHTGNANGNLDMSSYATSASAGATGLIGIPSSGCSQKFRVVLGDPRSTSSVLIDKNKEPRSKLRGIQNSVS